MKNVVRKLTLTPFLLRKHRRYGRAFISCCFLRILRILLVSSGALFRTDLVAQEMRDNNYDNLAGINYKTMNQIRELGGALESFRGFSRVDKILCGAASVIITSSCTAVDESDLYCHMQSVDFTDITNGSSASIAYEYPFGNEYEAFISGASCMQMGRQTYIALLSTNFGNCKICEWVDVFSENGAYLGSTNGMYNSSNFPHKPLSIEIFSYIKNRHPFSSEEHIEIDRSPKD